jgi:hypothetical protein
VAVAWIGVALWWSAGCNEVRLAGDDDDDDAAATEPTSPAGGAVTLDAAAAFDPLRAPLAIAVTAPPGAAVSVEVVAEGGAAVWAAEATADDAGAVALSWDGRIEGGEIAAAGAHRLRASADDLEAEAALGIVRAGFVAAWLEGDEGVTATREPLFWPVARELQDEGEPIAALDAIDDGAVPLDFPAVAPGPMAVRPDGAEPAAFIYDARPILALQVADVTGDGGPTGLDATEVAVAVDGWTVLEGSPLVPGAAVVLQRDEPLGDTVGVSELTLELALSAGGDPLGVQILPLRIYRLLDVSAFVGAQDPYRPWAPVVEQALVAIDGAPAEPYAVVDALVEFVYNDLGLTYDTDFGASAYSEYSGWSYQDPHFLLSDFLVRRFGSVINCSDAGNILGAYANMVGARLDHLILSPGFDLNYIHAIGTAEHTRCPFGVGGCGFNYHAVTTIPESGAIWDATLALDGDAAPGASPSIDLMVQAISGAEYLDRLVRSGDPQYQNQAQETLQ